MAIPVPEPSRRLLLAAGLGCLVALCRVRERREDWTRIASPTEKQRASTAR